MVEPANEAIRMLVFAGVLWLVLCVLTWWMMHAWPTKKPTDDNDNNNNDT